MTAVVRAAVGENSLIAPAFGSMMVNFTPEPDYVRVNATYKSPEELTRPLGLLILGRLHGRPVGCGVLKFHKKQPAELKRMWIAGSARGLGVGRRLLAELERHARKAGVKVLRLETNRTLYEAIRLYRSSGYIEVEAFNAEPYAHHWFEKQLAVSDLNRNHNRKGEP